MSHDDELRSRIGRLAETHEVAPLTADEVVARRSRGARRQRLLAVAAAVLLFGGVAGAVVLFTGDDPDVDVADGADDGADQGITVEGTDDRGSEPGDGDAPPSSTDEATVPTTTLMFPEGGDAIDMGFGGPDWVVPWGDGFLSVGQIFEPSDVGFEDLVPDARDRFPAAIIEAVEAAGAVTLQEMIDAVTEAGLLDEATEIFTADPELLDAFNEVQSGGTWRFAAQVSDDGETWTELPDFALPSGQEWAQQVASDGATLVVVEQIWNDAGDDTVQVSTTTDLTEWTVTDIPMPADTTPDFVQADTFVNDLALGADGWYTTLSRNTWIDLWSMVPEDLLAELNELDAGYGFEPAEEGLQVVIYEYDDIAFDDGGADFGGAEFVEPATTVPAPEPFDEPFDEPFEPEVHSVIPWSELPLTYDEYLEFAFGQFDTIAFVGGFDGSIAAAAAPEGFDECCTVVGTDAGFLAQGWRDGPALLAFSADGQTWSDVALPAGIDWINALAAVQGGAVMVDQDGGVWRAEADGANWQAVTIPDLPENTFLWFQDTGGRGIATAVDVGVWASGAVATAPQEDIAPAEDIAPPGEFIADYWLVATVDGISWHVEDLPEMVNDGYVGQAAVNGSVAVLRTWNGDWQAFAIG